MNKIILKKIGLYASLLLTGLIVGVITEHQLCVGYELSDLFKFCINKLVSLLQSFAFVILVIAIMLRASITDLINKVRDNVEAIVEGLARKQVKTQEKYQNKQERSHKAFGELGI